MELFVPAGDNLLLLLVDGPVHRRIGMAIQHVAAEEKFISVGYRCMYIYIHTVMYVCTRDTS